MNSAPTFEAATGFKYLVPLFQGGKQAGSAVKFAKFYLVVDPALATPDSLNQALKIFQTTLRKSMQ